jgi:hypothetical protein
MTPSLEEAITLDFITSASTGAAADADSTPTFEVFENATDTALTLSGSTIAKRTGKTGNYRITFTCAASDGFEAGKSYNVIVSATIGGVAAKCKVGTFQVRTRDTDDLLPTASYTSPPSAATVSATVWTELTRTLTSGANIVLAKGTGVTGFNDLDAAGVRDAVGLAAANLDTQLTAIDDFLDTEIATIITRLGVPASSLAADIAALNDLSAADVWGYASGRTLSAGTNIVLAKGTGVTGFNDLSTAQVNAEVVDCLAVDTYAEATAPPAATSTLAARLVWMGMIARNKGANSATEGTLYADNGTTPIATRTLAKAGGVVTAGKWASA